MELVHHVVDEHKWDFAIPYGFNCCGITREKHTSEQSPQSPETSTSRSQHSSDTEVYEISLEEKKLLKPGSKSNEKLREIVFSHQIPEVRLQKT